MNISLHIFMLNCGNRKNRFPLFVSLCIMFKWTLVTTLQIFIFLLTKWWIAIFYTIRIFIRFNPVRIWFCFERFLVQYDVSNWQGKCGWYWMCFYSILQIFVVFINYNASILIIFLAFVSSINTPFCNFHLIRTLSINRKKCTS